MNQARFDYRFKGLVYPEGQPLGWVREKGEVRTETIEDLHRQS